MVYNGTGISGLITYQKTIQLFLQNINLVLAHSLIGPKTVLGHLVTRAESETREMKENKPN